jgi:putative ABC transport system ATP-binding protein
MGPSGSGKSTLMNLIGLLDRPTHGEYKLNDRSVAKLRQNRRAKIRRDKVGFIFQSFNLIPRLNVLENVALPLSYKGMLQTRRLKRAGNMLEQVGLADREYFFPKQLSGGQSQRVAIARALVNNPEVIIADEPTGNLDSGSSRVVMELLANLHKQGHTILMVTHNPELTRYAGRVLFMHDGEVIADERTKVGDVPELAQKFYHLPKQTQDDHLAGISALMSAIPHKKMDKKKHKTKKSNKKRNYKTKVKTKEKK